MSFLSLSQQLSRESLKLRSNLLELQLEMNELKERLEIEKQGWIENYMKKQVRCCSKISTIGTVIVTSRYTFKALFCTPVLQQ